LFNCEPFLSQETVGFEMLLFVHLLFVCLFMSLFVYCLFMLLFVDCLFMYVNICRFSELQQLYVRAVKDLSDTKNKVEELTASNQLIRDEYDALHLAYGSMEKLLRKLQVTIFFMTRFIQINR